MAARAAATFHRAPGQPLPATSSPLAPDAFRDCMARSGLWGGALALATLLDVFLGGLLELVRYSATAGAPLVGAMAGLGVSAPTGHGRALAGGAIAGAAAAAVLIVTVIVSVYPLEGFSPWGPVRGVLTLAYVLPGAAAGSLAAWASRLRP